MHNFNVIMWKHQKKNKLREGQLLGGWDQLPLVHAAAPYCLLGYRPADSSIWLTVFPSTPWLIVLRDYEAYANDPSLASHSWAGPTTLTSIHRHSTSIPHPWPKPGHVITEMCSTSDVFSLNILFVSPLSMTSTAPTLCLYSKSPSRCLCDPFLPASW